MEYDGTDTSEGVNEVQSFGEWATDAIVERNKARVGRKEVFSRERANNGALATIRQELSMWA